MLEKITETRKQVANLLTLIRSKQGKDFSDEEAKDLLKQTAEIVFQDLLYRLIQIEMIQDEELGKKVIDNMMEGLKKTQKKEEEVK